MAQIVDTRGLSCPQPVILVNKALREAVFPIEVLVDTVTSRENVRRMAEKQGCSVVIAKQEDDFKLVLQK
jgi:TusA-related sulfurtransferase